MLNSMSFPAPTPWRRNPIADQAFFGPDQTHRYRQIPDSQGPDPRIQDGHQVYGLQPFGGFDFLQSLFQLMTAWSSFMGGGHTHQHQHHHHPRQDNPYGFYPSQQPGADQYQVPRQLPRNYSTPAGPWSQSF